MSHHKHTIEAFILHVAPAREHDVRIKMITRDGEVLSAIATGLRTLKSKLRMSLVPYAHASVSIVKGKDMWRLTNAQPLHHYYSEIESSDAKKALARTTSLIEKLTPGEMHIGSVFEIMLEYIESLKKGQNIQVHETYAALQIMSALGYLDNNEKWSNADIDYVEQNIKEAIADVNHGIKATHLV